MDRCSSGDNTEFIKVIRLLHDFENGPSVSCCNYCSMDWIQTAEFRIEQWRKMTNVSSFAFKSRDLEWARIRRLFNIMFSLKLIRQHISAKISTSEMQRETLKLVMCNTVSDCF